MLWPGFLSCLKCLSFGFAEITFQTLPATIMKAMGKQSQNLGILDNLEILARTFLGNRQYMSPKAIYLTKNIVVWIRLHSVINK